MTTHSLLSLPSELRRAPALCTMLVASTFGLTACSEQSAPASNDQAATTAAEIGETEAQLIERARGIHDRVITIDTHADINTGNFTETVNYTMNLDTQVNLVKMAAGRLDVAWFIVYTGQSTLDEEG